MPEATVAPTEAATVGGTIGGTEEDVSFAPSEDVTETVMPEPDEKTLETFAPTEDATEASVSEDSKSVSEDEPSCTENPATHVLNIDLQIDFAGGAVETCSEEEEESVMNTISAALEEGFAKGEVPNWDGSARFHDFNFDAAGSVDTVGGFVELRRLRGQAMANARRLALQSKGHRKLATCDARGDLPCDTGYCRWGCLEVDTTHCSGNPTLDQMEVLSGYLKTALNAMEFRPDCLGTFDGLKAAVLVEGGREFVEAPPTAPPTSEGTSREDMFVPMEPEEESEAEDKGPAPAAPAEDRNNDIAMTDGDDIFKVRTVVTVKYFDGQGGIMEGEKLDVFNTRLEQLEASVLKKATFGPGFAKYQIRDLEQAWDEETNTLTLEFVSHVELLPGYGNGQNDHKIARVMAEEPDFKEHIHTLMEYQIGGINQLTFTCTGHGERR